ncbi:MAG TPA: septum formation initiator family protein [Streptosporangiaceae bacterium]|jgi:cell division protein FtsB|nr:septum formation initiator family protein [Streptosporangiaceae bacterium]
MADPPRAPHPDSSPPSPPRPGRPPLRPTKLTGRAALLAVVMCAIALSLAYPVREYIGQRQQIDQLLNTQQSLSAQVKNLQTQQQQFSDPNYIEQQARDQLHMCLPTEKCYVIIGNNSPAPDATTKQTPTPLSWYSKLWGSVKKADQPPGK